MAAAFSARAGQVVTDGSLGHGGPLTGPSFSIPASLGRQIGPNLFHSFSSFNLDKGEVATFTASAATSNIVARVTGGSPSNIDGTISTRLDTNSAQPHPANFYLINSAGVVFGPDAKLDVGRSFTVTTADALKLADGSQFRAAAVGTDVLTTAAPAAFGFLAPKPAGVSVAGALAVPAGKSLSVVSGDINIVGGSLLAPGGNAALVSVASPGTVTQSSGGPAVDTFKTLGAISLSQSALVSVDGPAGGSLVVRSGALSLDHSSLSAQTTGAGTGAGIDVKITGSLLLTASYINANTTGVGNAGPISVAAADITVDGAGAQDVPGIVAKSRSVGAGGRGGDIAINAMSLQLLNGAQIGADSYGQGRGGDVSVNANSVSLDGKRLDLFTGISSDTFASGASGSAGNVSVHAQSLQIIGGASVESDTYGHGAAGFVDINGGSILLDGMGSSSINGISSSSRAGATGAAGSVTVVASSLRVLNASQIASDAFGAGAAGSVHVNAGSFMSSGAGANDFTGVSSSGLAGSTGSAGEVTIQATTIQLLDGSGVASDTFGSGRAGAIQIDAGTLAMNGMGASRLTAVSSTAGPGSTSNAGDVTIRASTIELFDGGVISSGTFGTGSGGSVRIDANSVLLNGSGSPGLTGITTDSGQGATGSAGAVALNVANLQVLRGAEISSDTSGLGRAGDVQVIATGNILIDGRRSRFTDISSQSLASGPGGDAGDVTVHAGENLIVRGGGQIQTGTDGFGGGGALDIAGREVIVNGTGPYQAKLSAVSALEADAPADAGTKGGDAGSIRIQAGILRVLNRGSIDSDTFGTGVGGDIAVTARRVDIKGLPSFSFPAAIEAESFDGFPGAGAAGSVSLMVKGPVQLLGGRLLVDSAAANGGDINVRATNLTSANGQILTEAAGNGGNIGLFARSVYLSDGRVSANGGGNGGNITIQNFQLGGGTVITATGHTGVSGRVQLSTPDQTLAGSLVLLQAAIVGPLATLEPACGVRVSGDESSFVVTNSGGEPPAPGGWFPQLDLHEWKASPKN